MLAYIAYMDPMGMQNLGKNNVFGSLDVVPIDDRR